MSAGGEGHFGPCDQLRASGRDRERVIEILKEAFAEGRLDNYNFAERIIHAQAPRSYEQLQP